MKRNKHVDLGPRIDVESPTEPSYVSMSAMNERICFASASVTSVRFIKHPIAHMSAMGNIAESKLEFVERKNKRKENLNPALRICASRARALAPHCNSIWPFFFAFLIDFLKRIKTAEEEEEGAQD